MSFAAREKTSSHWLLTCVQSAPLSSDTNTSLYKGAATRLAPFSANEIKSMFGRPVLAAVQIAPVSVVRKAPSVVSANSFEPIRGRHGTLASVNPVFDSVQLAPLSVER